MYLFIQLLGKHLLITPIYQAFFFRDNVSPSVVLLLVGVGPCGVMRKGTVRDPQGRMKSGDKIYLGENKKLGFPVSHIYPSCHG